MDKLTKGTLVKIIDPGYNLRCVVGSFTQYWTAVGENKEMIMARFPGYEAERAFFKEHCIEPTEQERKEYFKQLLQYGG